MYCSNEARILLRRIVNHRTKGEIMREKQYFRLFFENVDLKGFPHDPISGIEICSLSSSSESNGIGQIGPNCINASEICHYADKMIEELEEIKKEAQKLYDKNKSAIAQKSKVIKRMK